MSRKRPDFEEYKKRFLEDDHLDLGFFEASSLYKDALRHEVEVEGAVLDGVRLSPRAGGGAMDVEVNINHFSGSYIVRTVIENGEEPNSKVKRDGLQVTGPFWGRRKVVNKARKILRDPEGNLAKSVGLEDGELRIKVTKTGIIIKNLEKD